MNKEKVTKTTLATKLGIKPQAISNWERDNKIPAEACIKLEPIIKIKARKLFLNPSSLFDMFNYNKSESNK